MRRVFRARGKLVGTSDFVVTRGYVQIRVVGFPWETASLEAVVRCQDGALLLRRERAEARLWSRAAHCVLSPPWLRRGALLHRVSSHRDATPSEVWGARALGSRRDKAVDEFVELVLGSLS